jgi:protein SCO1/2
MAPPERATSPQEAALRQSDFAQKPGEHLPLDALFRDEDGAPVVVGELTRDLPVLLVFAYYRCPMLCTVVLNGLAQGLNRVSLQPGTDYRVVVVSIDPTEGPDLAREKKENYLARIGRDTGAVSGWRFLTGSAESIGRLADAAGFRYALDSLSGEYAHPAGAVAVSPGGRISSYLFGLEFRPRDLRLALVEASAGRVGSLVDRILLTCFRYDPTLGRHTPAVNLVLRLLGLLTVAVLGGFILASVLKERKTARNRGAGGPHRERQGTAHG